jgi:hypothetical protein
MINREHELPITKQAQVLHVSRGSVYYLPRPVSATDLGPPAHMHAIQTPYTARRAS